MTTFPTTIPDVLASQDVLVDVQNLSDSLSAEECVEYRIACEKVLRQAQEAVKLLNMQMVKVLEHDVIRDGRRFYVGHKKDRVRFQHSAIQAQVVTTAVARVAAGMTSGSLDEHYEMYVRAGAREAADLMAKVYISDSTDARVGAVNALGLNTDRHNPKSVRTWEKGEKAVFDVPAGGAVE